MDINKVILIGRLGKDAEIKYTQANAPVANVSLATERRWNLVRSSRDCQLFVGTSVPRTGAINRPAQSS